VSWHLWALAGVFALTVGVPLAATAREFLRPRDRDPLPVDPRYTRQPRHFGIAFRERFRETMESLPQDAEAWPSHFGSGLGLGATASLRVVDAFPDAGDARNDDLIVATGPARVAASTSVRRLYAMAATELGAGASVDELAVDGSCRLHEGTRIRRWMDIDGSVSIAPGSSLGRSAAASAELLVAPGCHFGRLWGSPVRVGPIVGVSRQADPVDDPETIDHSVIYARQSLTLPPGTRLERDLVAYGDVTLGAGCEVTGNLKIHGDLRVGSEARLCGSVFVEGRARIASGAEIDGNLRAEGDVLVGADARIGSPERPRSVVSQGSVHLEAGAVVYGWVVAEAGGTT